MWGGHLRRKKKTKKRKKRDSISLGEEDVGNKQGGLRGGENGRENQWKARN